MNTSYHHMRYTDNTGNLSQFGGVTFFGDYNAVDDLWEVSAAATHPTDRFNRKKGCELARKRWMQYDTFNIPAGVVPHFSRDLYAYLKTTNGNVYFGPRKMSFIYPRSSSKGVSNMIRSTYQKVVKPPKAVITDKVLRSWFNDVNAKLKSPEGQAMIRLARMEASDAEINDAIKAQMLDDLAIMVGL